MSCFDPQPGKEFFRDSTVMFQACAQTCWHAFLEIFFIALPCAFKDLGKVVALCACFVVVLSEYLS